MKKILFIFIMLLGFIPTKAYAEETVLVGLTQDDLLSISNVLEPKQAEETLVGVFSIDDFFTYAGYDMDILNNLDLFYSVVEAEALGGTYEQKLNVASCIVNRRNYVEWCPDDIYNVIMQKGQFAVVGNDMYKNVTITDSTKLACNYLLMNDPVHECIYFCSTKSKKREGSMFYNMTPEFFDGIHYHFK